MGPRSTPKLQLCVTAVAALLGLPFAIADDGIWLLNRFPKDRVAKKYGFSVSDDFLKRVQSASVRLNSGGSGSFVSPQGLIFTNHHVASDCIQKLSTPQNDYMNHGFHARTEAEEKACPDLEVNVLLEITDVTERVNSSITSDTPVAKANQMRKAAMTAIEKECSEKSGNRCDAVTLYSGGMYHLYRYKKYTDIRLVFAPEVAIAAFGGDPDNFTYPRYCLDFAFFRAYEGGKPAPTPNHLKWSRTGARDGELTFVSGHPGSTGRLATLAELEFSRDVSYPFVLEMLGELVKAFQVFSSESAENKRQAQDQLFSFQNSFKAYTGFMVGLRDPELMARKRDEEKTLRSAVESDAERKKKWGSTWDEVAAAYTEYRQFYLTYSVLERNAARGSELFDIARKVLRYAAEKQKPNDQRLREFVDPALPSLEQAMYSTAPIHPSMEVVALTEYFRMMEKILGPQDPLVRTVLGGKQPKEAAQAFVSASKLTDVGERKKLAADAKALQSSEDGMIRLARLLDPKARELRRRYEDKVEATINSSAARIAQARFAVFGPEDYPDATFTLRLSYGPVKGYQNAKGKAVPWATDFAGVYKRATGKEPFALPPSWIKAKKSLNLKTPYNFVTTNDTHGGNSGSPTIDTKGEVIGILFDGNIEGLPNRFVYRDLRERSVHVASQGIVEALRKVYGATRILTELGM
jgi:hypothetical protein